MFADEMLVKGSQSADVDKSLFNDFIKAKYNRSLDDLGISQETAMANLKLFKENELTLTGLLLFSEKRQFFKPLFYHSMCICKIILIMAILIQTVNLN